MATKLPRFFQKIFAGNYSASPSSQIAQFGSSAAGVPAYTGDLGQLQALPQYLNGWLAGVVGNKSPTAQDVNALFYLVTAQLANIFQDGVPEYDPNTIYFSGSFLKSGSTLYICTTPAGTEAAGIPLTNTTNFGLYKDYIASQMQGVAKAWVNFSVTGGYVSVASSYNVSGVAKTSTGNYLITLGAGVFADGNYSFTASSTQNDSSGTAQVMTRFPGDTKTAAQFQLRSVNATDSNQYDATDVSVVFYR